MYRMEAYFIGFGAFSSVIWALTKNVSQYQKINWKVESKSSFLYFQDLDNNIFLDCGVFRGTQGVFTLLNELTSAL